mmetsp:Transcript_41620/g.97391  ORF Transcript_41620/g.97391 Transcript_41620/m.97391 type:complete len:206 (-) Transcript_41620:607-1224(-)
MGRIECLVAEHAVDREVLLRLELPLLRQLGDLVEGSRRDGGRVRAEQVLPRLLLGPIVTPAKRARVVLVGKALATVLVGRLDAREIVRRQLECRRGRLDEESVVRVAGGVLLWLEERVEIPEGRLDVLVRLHLFEAHRDKSLTEHGAHLHQRMQSSSSWRHAAGVHIHGLEDGPFPRPLDDHLVRQIREGLLAEALEQRPRRDLE